MSQTIGAEPGPGWGPPDPEHPAWPAPNGHLGPDGAHRISQQDIDAYLPLVRRVVQNVARRLPANVQRDDLLAAGVFGLVDSLRRNGGDGGAAFAWYARVRIRGAIFDELRAQDWLPRRLRDRLAGSEGPTCFVSFEDVASGEVDIACDDDPAALLEASSQRRALTSALAQLPERDRQIVGRYYFDGARLKDIGAEFGLSEPRISQILSRAVGKLRDLLVIDA